MKHKLQQLGIKGKFLDVITSIYSSTKVSLSYTNYVSTQFSTSIGLKQGDILSTMFFNLFINDLPMLLEKHNTQSGESESPELFNTQISSLWVTRKTRNVTRCNNRDDLLHLSFTLKISIFSEATQSNIYDGAFITRIVSL